MHSKTRFVFSGILEKVKISFINTVVFIPRDIIVQLPKGKNRVMGLMNGAPFSICIQYRKNGTQFFPVNAALREAAAIRPGDPVKVIFNILDAHQVEISPEETTPGADDNAGRVWNGFTADLQPTLKHYIETVKKVDSRVRNAIDVVQKSGLKKVLVLPSKNRKSGS